MWEIGPSIEGVMNGEAVKSATAADSSVTQFILDFGLMECHCGNGDNRHR